jgi:DNA-binding transcriptional LysR family regulator
VDIGILPEAEAMRLPGVLYRRSRMERGCLVIPRSHPKADLENPTLRDFADETFLVLPTAIRTSSPRIKTALSESRYFAQSAYRAHLRHDRHAAGNGAGISIMNAWNALRNAPHLKCLKLPDIYVHIEAVAWHKDNKNPNIAEFLSRVTLEDEQDAPTLKKINNECQLSAYNDGPVPVTDKLGAFCRAASAGPDVVHTA